MIKINEAWALGKRSNVESKFKFKRGRLFKSIKNFRFNFHWVHGLQVVNKNFGKINQFNIFSSAKNSNSNSKF